MFLYTHRTREFYSQQQQQFLKASTLNLTDFPKAVLGYIYIKINAQKLTIHSEQIITQSEEPCCKQIHSVENNNNIQQYGGGGINVTVMF
jgi:hypothetical protein